MAVRANGLERRWSSRTITMNCSRTWTLSMVTKWKKMKMAFQSHHRLISTKRSLRLLLRASQVERANSTRSCSSRPFAQQFHMRTRCASQQIIFATFRTRRPAQNLQRLKIGFQLTESVRLTQCNRKKFLQKVSMMMVRTAQVTSYSQSYRKWISATLWWSYASGIVESPLVITASEVVSSSA